MSVEAQRTLLSFKSPNEHLSFCDKKIDYVSKTVMSKSQPLLRKAKPRMQKSWSTSTLLCNNQVKCASYAIDEEFAFSEFCDFHCTDLSHDQSSSLSVLQGLSDTTKNCCSDEKNWRKP